MSVPPLIIDVALKAIEEQTSAGFRHKYGAAEKWHVVVALNAALPLFIAAERERIRQLADEVLAVYWPRPPRADGLPLLFADLLPPVVLDLHGLEDR